MRTTVTSLGDIGSRVQCDWTTLYVVEDLAGARRLVARGINRAYVFTMAEARQLVECSGTRTAPTTTRAMAAALVRLRAKGTTT